VLETDYWKISSKLKKSESTRGLNLLIHDSFLTYMTKNMHTYTRVSNYVTSRYVTLQRIKM